MDKHGIYSGVPEKVYHAYDCASSSGIKLLIESARKYELREHLPRKQTAAMRLGSALHCALLEPEEYGSRYVMRPEFGGKGSVAERKAWDDLHADYTVIGEEESTAVDGMLASVMSHPIMSRTVGECETELTLRWLDAESDIECKARLDAYHRSFNYIYDIKTTESIDPDKIARTCEDYKYAIQAAVYTDAAIACRLPVIDFYFVFVEKSQPYCCSVVRMDRDWIESGRKQYKRALQDLAAYQTMGKFPGQHTTIDLLQQPAWARRKNE